jgi:hypothetical protein
MEEMNQTELIYLCRKRGLRGASRSIPLDTIRKVLTGEEPPESLGDPINRHRKAISKLLDKEPSLKDQLRCDFDHAMCPPAKVLDCFQSLEGDPALRKMLKVLYA